MKPIFLLSAFFLLLFGWGLPACSSSGQSGTHYGNEQKTKNNVSRTREIEIIVKLTQGANVDSLANAYSRYNVKPVQCLAPNHNMWLLTATVGNGYALVEILRKDKKVENAEINNAINPRQ